MGDAAGDPGAISGASLAAGAGRLYAHELELLGLLLRPDRVSATGGFAYGAASIERADCDGTKTAVIHLARVEESGKRWIILDDVRGPMQAVKPKLTKCAAEGSEWGLSATSEPVASGKDIDSWADAVVKQWSYKGYDVSVRKEKTVVLD